MIAERHQIETPGRILDGLQAGGLRFAVLGACPSWHADTPERNTMTTDTRGMIRADTLLAALEHLDLDLKRAAESHHEATYVTDGQARIAHQTRCGELIEQARGVRMTFDLVKHAREQS